MTRHRILVVDDQQMNIELVAGIFDDDDHEVLFALNGERALEIAATENPQVILLDVMMPDMDGYEVCRKLKADCLTRDIPVIFITALDDGDAETKGLELGAADYITKPLRPNVVEMRVKNQIELKLAREQLTRLTITDGLTGLSNRRCFDETLNREHARHARSGAELTLILLDIDHFKAFNDTYGHLAGDDCLRRIGRVIADCASRPADLAARYGGEEFACILPETDRAGAGIIAERIRRGIQALAIPQGGSDTADCVTASLGVVTMFCKTDDSATGIISQADALLYRAKSLGRNRVESSKRERV